MIFTKLSKTAYFLEKWNRYFKNQKSGIRVISSEHPYFPKDSIILWMKYVDNLTVGPVYIMTAVIKKKGSFDEQSVVCIPDQKNIFISTEPLLFSKTELHALFQQPYVADAMIADRFAEIAKKPNHIFDRAIRLHELGVRKEYCPIEDIQTSLRSVSMRTVRTTLFRKRI